MKLSFSRAIRWILVALATLMLTRVEWGQLHDTPHLQFFSGPKSRSVTLTAFP